MKSQKLKTSCGVCMHCMYDLIYFQLLRSCALTVLLLLLLLLGSPIQLYNHRLYFIVLEKVNIQLASFTGNFLLLQFVKYDVCMTSFQFPLMMIPFSFLSVCFPFSSRLGQVVITMITGKII